MKRLALVILLPVVLALAGLLALQTPPVLNALAAPNSAAVRQLCLSRYAVGIYAPVWGRPRNQPLAAWAWMYTPGCVVIPWNSWLPETLPITWGPPA